MSLTPQQAAGLFVSAIVDDRQLFDRICTGHVASGDLRTLRESCERFHVWINAELAKRQA